MGFCDNVRTASFPVYLLIMIFAMSTWIDIVGIWVEMPLMVNVLPEGWNLPAYLTIIIQCANIGPAVYATVDKIRSTKRRERNSSQSERTLLNMEMIVTFTILSIGAVSLLLMSFFWSKTTFVFGADRSVAFMVLVFTSALVSCMSSVVFLPYMARFKPVYISAYYIGQGLCGLVPGMVGLVQGAGKRPDCINSTRTIINESLGTNETEYYLHAVYPPPLFSVDAFFQFLFACFCASIVAYYCLNFCQFSLKEMVQHLLPAAVIQSKSCCNEQENMTAAVATAECSDQNGAESKNLLTQQNGSEQSDKSVDCSDITVQEKVQIVTTQPPVDPIRVAVLLVMIAIVSALTNGILPATQSYTCLPFGNMAYTLSIRLSSVAGPLASLSSMFLPRPKLGVVVGLTSAASCIAAFHLVLAAQSPFPVMKGQMIGEVIVIVSSVIMASFFSFVRVSVASILRVEGSRRGLLWCGGITQLGSLCGALVTFVLVSVLHVFHSEKACS